MKLSNLVRAAMRGDDLGARQWVKDALRVGVDVSRLDAPTDLDETEMATCAALVELMAIRAGVAPPAWVGATAGAREAVYLDADAPGRPKFRRLLEQDSPEPLRRRNVFAVSQYLDIRF